jgi:methylthioribose-1-phosphate isomerase
VARENNIPVYAAVPTSTIDLTIKSGDEIEIEERTADEVTCVNGVRIAPVRLFLSFIFVIILN